MADLPKILGPLIVGMLVLGAACGSEADPEELESLDPNVPAEENDSDGSNGDDDSGDGGSEGDVSVFSLRVGDCFDDVSLEPTEVSDVPAVSCDTPHDNEVFHVWQISGGDFPGEEPLNTQGIDGCLEPFETYVGVDYTDSRLDLFPISPTAESWEQGDREIVCALYDLSLEQLTESMKGSGE